MYLDGEWGIYLRVLENCRVQEGEKDLNSQLLMYRIPDSLLNQTPGGELLPLPMSP